MLLNRDLGALRNPRDFEMARTIWEQARYGTRAVATQTDVVGQIPLGPVPTRRLTTDAAVQADLLPDTRTTQDRLTVTVRRLTSLTTSMLEECDQVRGEPLAPLPSPLAVEQDENRGAVGGEPLAPPPSTSAQSEMEVEGPPPLEDAQRQPLAVVDPRQKPPTSAKGKTCPLCGQRVSRLAAHMRTTHFPWFWEPTAACWHCCLSLGRAECLESHLLSCPAPDRAHFTGERQQQWTQLMCGAIAVLLEVGRASTAQDLVARIVPRLPVDFSVREEELAMITLHDQAAFGAWHDVPRTGYDSLPEAILHWRVVAEVLQPLSDQARAWFVRTGRYLETGGRLDPDVRHHGCSPPRHRCHGHPRMMLRALLRPRSFLERALWQDRPLAGPTPRGSARASSRGGRANRK